MAGYLRLYPGFDGVASNGLQYGAQAEIRENTETSATAGASTETLYVLRDFGYLGLPQLGLVRFGQQEGALYLNDAGRFESGKEAFDDGGWNGDIQNFFVNSSARPIYPWTWSNSTRTTDKFDYISPDLQRPELRLQLRAEPDRLKTTLRRSPRPRPATDLRRNTLEIGATYKATLGPVGVNRRRRLHDRGSGRLHTPPTARPALPEPERRQLRRHADLCGLHRRRQHQVRQHERPVRAELQGRRDAVGWLAGGLYTIGQMTVGASYFVYDSQGDWSSPTTEGTRRETGAAAGATYIAGTRA